MQYLPFILILAAIIFAFLQVSGLLLYPKSRVNIGWLGAVTVLIGALIYLGFKSSATPLNLLIYSLLISIALWSNLIKFTLGLIEENEITTYNRYEHIATGMLAYYGLHIINFTNFFPITFNAGWANSLFILLSVNMLSVVIEMGGITGRFVFREKLYDRARNS